MPVRRGEKNSSEEIKEQVRRADEENEDNQKDEKRGGENGRRRCCRGECQAATSGTGPSLSFFRSRLINMRVGASRPPSGQLCQRPK